MQSPPHSAYQYQFISLANNFLTRETWAQMEVNMVGFSPSLFTMLASLELYQRRGNSPC